jgi:hypothetical protein
MLHHDFMKVNSVVHYSVNIPYGVEWGDEGAFPEDFAPYSLDIQHFPSQLALLGFVAKPDMHYLRWTELAMGLFERIA